MFRKPIIGRFLSYHRHENPSPAVVAFREWIYRTIGHPYLLDVVRAERVFKALNPKPKQRVLDMGCGWGVWSVALMETGVKMVAVDLPNEDFFEAHKSARINNLSIDFLLADGQALPFREDVFDGIIMLDVLEHIPNDVKAIQESKRVIKEDGAVVGTVPTIEKDKIIIKEKMVKNELTREDLNLGHHRRYTLKRILKLIKSVGMKVAACGYYNQQFSEVAEEIREFLRRHKIPDYLIFPFLYPLAKIDDYIISEGVKGSGCYFKAVKTTKSGDT